MQNVQQIIPKDSPTWLDLVWFVFIGLIQFVFVTSLIDAKYGFDLQCGDAGLIDSPPSPPFLPEPPSTL